MLVLALGWAQYVPLVPDANMCGWAYMGEVRVFIRMPRGRAGTARAPFWRQARGPAGVAREGPGAQHTALLPFGFAALPALMCTVRGR